MNNIDRLSFNSLKMKYLSKYSFIILAYILYTVYYFVFRDNFIEKLIELSVVTIFIILIFIIVDYIRK